MEEEPFCGKVDVETTEGVIKLLCPSEKTFVINRQVYFTSIIVDAQPIDLVLFSIEVEKYMSK